MGIPLALLQPDSGAKSQVKWVDQLNAIQANWEAGIANLTEGPIAIGYLPREGDSRVPSSKKKRP